MLFDIDDLNFASFADDNTPYSFLSEITSVLDKILDWFKKNFLK